MNNYVVIIWLEAAVRTVRFAATLIKWKENVIEIQLRSSVVLFVKIICLPCYSNAPVQQQCDISEENTPYAPPPDDQRVYDFAQDGTPDLNLCAVVHNHSRKDPVEPDQLYEYQAFNETPTNSAGDATQHYAVINKQKNKRNSPVYDELNRKI